MGKADTEYKKIATLVGNCPPLPNIGLLSGSSGLSLFLFYSGKYFKDNLYTEKGMEHLNAIFNSIAENNYYPPNFCAGLAGFGWTFNHLADNEFIEAEANQIEDIDDIVFEAALKYMDNLSYDFFHGAVGVGLYFVMRNNLSEKNYHYLDRIVNTLYQIRVETEKGICWRDYFSIIGENEQSDTIRYNLGMAHGLPSIIIFLCKCYEKGIQNELTKRMIEGAVEYIKNNKLPSQSSSTSLYPTWIDIGKDLPQNSRLAWCYGDIGIASGFWQAGKLLKREEWKQESIKIMLHASYKKELSKNGVMDAGICHGTAGIAHLFNRFYFETKMPVFKEASSYWIDQTLKMAYHADGLAGYRSWQAVKGWVNEYNLLDGVAGIGLALLAHTSDEEPTWDKCLLLS